MKPILALFLFLMIMGASILGLSGKHQMELRGNYLLVTKGVEFEMSFDSSGSFYQVISMPDGEKHSSTGTWRLVTSNGKQYLNAQSVLFVDICSYPDNDGLPWERAEVNYAVVKYFWVQERILVCSDGRSMTSN